MVFKPPVHKKEAGQLLIEILISLAILILVISGIMAAVTVSVRNSSFARNKSLANQYAQESIEFARKTRDENWSNVISGCCGQGALSGTPFNRTVQVAGSADEKTITVTVSWVEGGKTYNTTLKTILTNWR